MSGHKPNSIAEYKKWFADELGFVIDKKTQAHFESVSNKIHKDFEQSRFWSDFVKNESVYKSEYLSKTGYDLFVPSSFKLYVKPYDSFLLKTFRKNILDNRNWPKEPQGGWYIPDTCYSRINDIVRTLVMVKYLDGVEFVIKKLRELCDATSLKCNVYLEARDEGYYAGHVYVKQNFEIPKLSWDTEQVNVSVEIQITTQVQEVIRLLLHKYYEKKRITGNHDSSKWQWDYRNEQFVANYLGHILHYLEGMIMDVRDKHREET